MSSQGCLFVISFAGATLLIMMGVNAVGPYLYPPENGTAVQAAQEAPEKGDSGMVLILDYVSKNGSAENLAAKTKYEYMLDTNEISDKRWQHSLRNGCTTAKYTYGCCYDFPGVEFIVCVNITYLVHDYGLNFTVRLGNAVFSEEVSLRNPPPICLDTEYLIPYKLGKLCVRIHDIDVTATTVHFCAKLLVEVLIKSIYTKELGCVNIPIKYADQLTHQSFMQKFAHKQISSN